MSQVALLLSISYVPLSCCHVKLTEALVYFTLFCFDAVINLVFICRMQSVSVTKERQACFCSLSPTPEAILAGTLLPVSTYTLRTGFNLQNTSLKFVITDPYQNNMKGPISICLRSDLEFKILIYRTLQRTRQRIHLQF